MADERKQNDPAQNNAQTGAQTGADGETQEQARPARRTPEDWTNLVNQRIEEAMQNGAFDNLRNKGKRLDATPEPHVPPEMQMANSLLKNNDLAPAWISDRAAVLAAIDRFRGKLRAVVADFALARAEATTPQRGEQLDRLWQSYVDAWRDEVAGLNRRIMTQNLKQPVTFLEIFQLRLEDELRRAGAE